MKFLITAVLSIFFCFTAFATTQLPDIIIFNGIEYNLPSNPLESYFKKNPDKRPQADVISTGLHRGYLATFEIRDSQLFVKDIEVQYWDTTDKKSPRAKWKSVITEVFPDEKNAKVDWLSELVVLPFGKLVRYVDLNYNYGPAYEKYYLLEIDKGSYIKSKQFDNKDYEIFKDKQFSAYKKTNEYKETKARLKKMVVLMSI